MTGKLLTLAFPTRDWPTWARYLGTTVLVSLALALRLELSSYLSGYPVVIFFAAIIVSATLFDRGSGIFATFLSAAYAKFFLIVPLHSYAVANTADLVGMSLFIVIGISTAIIIEALHKAIFALTNVNEELADANRNIAEAEKDKDLLLQEAGHRIKNDLMTLASLIQLQRKLIADPDARSALLSTVERINVLAQLNDLLRRTDSLTQVNTSELLTAIGDHLRGLLQLRPVTVVIEAEAHDLSQQRALAVGLIANELMMNCLKYAFPEDRVGSITTTFRSDGDALELRVADDGVGMAFDASRGSATGMGERLVKGLAAQLRGKYERNPDGGDPGTVVTVRFPFL